MAFCTAYVVLCVFFTVFCMASDYDGDKGNFPQSRQAYGPFYFSCPYIATFERINEAFDENHNQVRIYHRPNRIQMIQTVSCVNQTYDPNRACPTCCGGVNPGSYRSKCSETWSLRKASLCDNPACTRGRIDWIYVKSGCTCMVEAIP